MTVSEAKQTQRKAGRAARKALGPEERKAANAALCGWLPCRMRMYAALVPQPLLAYPVCGEAPYSRCARPGRLGDGTTASAPPS